MSISNPWSKARIFAAAILQACLAQCVYAQSPEPSGYPDKPVKIVVPFSAGGGTDLLARMVGTKLTEFSGQPVIIDNRAGGNSIIGSDVVAKAPPDGYTLLFTTNAHVVNPGLYANLPYDTLRDFAPISLLIESPNVLVAHPALPVRTLKEFIAFAKARPHQINFGSGGNGSIGHLSMEMVKLMSGVDLVHIPYKSGGPALNALLGGEVSLTMSNIFTSAPYIRSGRLRALGVSSLRRSSTLPQVPTISEAGVAGFNADAWYGVFAPAKTPTAIVAKLNADMIRALKMPDVRQRIADDGIQAVGNSASEFAAVIKADMTTWARVIDAAHIVAN